MKIVATSDLHMPKHKDKMPQLIQNILDQKADVLLLLGDIAPANDELLESLLMELKEFPGPKLFVPGNHDLWTVEGSSRERYEKILPEIYERNGFHSLDSDPFVYEGVGFVGNIGWYDYSFARVYSPPPNTQFVRTKNSNAASITWDQIEKEDLKKKILYHKAFWGLTQIGCNDGEYMADFWDDEEFCQMMQKKLESHIRQIESQVNKIVAAFHCVPFKDALIRNNAEADVCFRNAFVGSKKLGELLYRHPKTVLSLWGHVHIRQNFSKGLIKCLNVSFVPDAKNPVVTEI